MSAKTAVSTRVIVRKPMNDHDTMTVEVEDTNETRHLVEYADPELRQTLAALPSGTTIPVSLSRVGARSNVWRVAELHHEPMATTKHAAQTSD
ncbi:hypothetical protein C499_04803 [Halogeometricum borinquense DSM 11551]|uniref:DUF7999 domain-containing protein n=2 Tax=Halogeometricum borinquense TaxID=60847 RepID=E4NTJ8_HALBP|nr:hypothetical protein [Halogeometricum borinquense]ADQ67050.1 hypothetical protein Hbor_14760 [Halogeometricum borinquense DSM 11551]ELY29597.1 hypothetical protein C499_04803 [Halogeometricum borinquense DSM 11551]RYJ13975.1 hypothetical protein ELS19_08360 [Halogeometricum borinquense]